MGSLRVACRSVGCCVQASFFWRGRSVTTSGVVPSLIDSGVMITSRTAQKHRDYATQLGANHYLGKPYSEEELLGLVARYAGADVFI